MIFELDNIELDYGGDRILSGVYIKAETGKITGILGANGTGKSSLMNIFFGSLSPSHKLVRIDSKAYLKPLFTTGLIRYLPQHSLIPKHLRVQQAFKMYRVDFEEFLSEFPEFEPMHREKAAALSGGERRIIEIYLSLKSFSHLVLLDEPFTHLSPLVIDRFEAIIKKEKQRKAMVISDHMYRQVLKVSDSLYLLKNGCSQLITNPRQLEEHRYVRPDASRDPQENELTGF